MNNWSGRIDPDGNSVIYQTCGAPQNMGHYCDKEIDALHQEARAATDPAARKAIYEKITAKFLAEGWIIYLYHPQIPDRAHRPAGRLQADARRADARDRREAEVAIAAGSRASTP